MLTIAGLLNGASYSRVTIGLCFDDMRSKKFSRQESRFYLSFVTTAPFPMAER